MRALVLGLAALLAVGCAPTVKIKYGQFALAYADAKALYTIVAVRLTDACKKTVLDATTCAYLDATRGSVKLIDDDVRALLRDPTTEPDWEKIGRYAEIVLGIGLKLSGL